MILRDAGIPVIAEAADGAQAVAAALEHHPDVVLMDIRMPEMDGLEATRRILASESGTGPDCDPAAPASPGHAERQTLTTMSASTLLVDHVTGQ